MIEWLWMFVHGLYWPLTVLALPVAIAAFILASQNRDRNKKLNWGDPKYQDLAASNWTIANIVGIYAILWILAAAVPAPNYNVRVIEKPVIHQQIVTRYIDRWHDGKQLVRVFPVPTYKSMYESCMKAADAGPDYITTEDVAQCNDIAAKASLPPYRVITHTVTKVQRDKYLPIFNNCISHLLVNVNGDNPDSADTLNFRLKRAELCHNEAIQASR